MKKNQKQGSISIQLLPEFGLPINGIPAYFTGSVFQGFVNIILPKKHKAERIRIIFHASETVQLHSTLTSVIRARDHQLFGTQRILWERSANDNNDDNNEPSSQYRFTIQLPMVQLPPSSEYKRLRYKCKYKLTAIIDYKPSFSTDLHPLLVCHQPVQYLPWIPTRGLKVPMIRHSKWLMIQMPNTDILPGDKLQFQVALSPLAMVTCLRSSLLGLEVVLELVQIATLPYQMEDERIPASESILKISSPTLVHAPPSSLEPILNYNNNNNNQASSSRRRHYHQPSSSTSHHRPRSIASSLISTTSTQRIQSSISSMTRITFVIPNDIPPTFTYGRIIHLQYELNIRILEKKSKNKSLWKTPPSLKSIMMNQTCLDEIRIPLLIGTLGHGIPIPDDLKNYTDFQGVFGDTISLETTATPSLSSSASPPFLNANRRASTITTTNYPLSRSLTAHSRNSINESHQNSNNNNNNNNHDHIDNNDNHDDDNNNDNNDNNNSNSNQEVDPTRLPVPKFVPCIEYDNSLPLYCPSTVPSY